MLGPHGADFFVRRELAPRNFRVRLVKVGFFLWRQLDRQLFDACKLQENRRKLVLYVLGQGGFNSLFKQSGHGRTIPQSRRLKHGLNSRFLWAQIPQVPKAVASNSGAVIILENAPPIQYGSACLP
jgi:hypothetical protein